VETETTFDDDGYRQAVLQRYYEVCERVADPDRSAVCKGAVFSLRRLAQSLSEDLSERQGGIYAADETWLDAMEAYSGLDTPIDTPRGSRPDGFSGYAQPNGSR